MKIFYCLLCVLFFTGTGIAQYGYVDGLSASQMGYKINDQKTGLLFTSKTVSSLNFELISTSNVEVYSGSLKFYGDKWTKKYYLIDFSEFKTSGNYKIRSNGFTSHTFRISDSVWRTETLHKEYFTSFLAYQRISHPARYSNDKSLKAYIKVNDNTTPVYQNFSKDCGSGSYSSTSTDKHVTIHVQSVNMLLWAFLGDKYMFNGQKIDGVTRLIDEAKWQLRFLLNMQDKDGGMFMGVHPGRKSYQGETVPVDRHVFVNKSTGLTARAMSSFALGSVVFQKEKDSVFASELLDAARKCAIYIEKNPNVYLPDVIRPSYWNGRFCSRILAAVEMYLALKDTYPSEAAPYREFVEKNIIDGAMSKGVWDSKGAGEDYNAGSQLRFGDIVFALCRFYPYSEATTKQKIKTSLSAYYDYFKERRTNPVGWIDDLIISGFGGCGHVAMAAPKFIMAGQVLGRVDIENLGKDQVQLLFGINPFHRTYVYGTGENTFPDIYGRPADGTIGGVVPGIKLYNENPIDDYRLDNSNSYTTGEATSAYTPAILLSLALMDNPLTAVPDNIVAIRELKDQQPVGNVRITMNQLTYSLPAESESIESYKIRIFDLMGNVISETPLIRSNTASIDVRTLTRGIYIMNVSWSGQNRNWTITKL